RGAAPAAAGAPRPNHTIRGGVPSKNLRVAKVSSYRPGNPPGRLPPRGFFATVPTATPSPPLRTTGYSPGPYRPSCRGGRGSAADFGDPVLPTCRPRLGSSHLVVKSADCSTLTRLGASECAHGPACPTPTSRDASTAPLHSAGSALS